MFRKFQHRLTGPALPKVHLSERCASIYIPYGSGILDIVKEEPGLAVTIKYHLKALGWNQGRLAEASGISPPQITGMFTGDRSFTRSHVNRIALAMALAYRDKKDPIFESFDALLNTFLTDAGFSAVPGLTDVIWTRLQGESGGSDERARKLRVAWIDYTYFSERTATGPEGLAIDITEQICRLIGADVDWIKCEWSNVIAQLETRTVDIVAPILMLLPSRLFKVEFTETVPNIRLGISGVVNKATKDRQRIAPICLKGEVGEELCTIVDLPDAAKPSTCEDMDEARKQLIESPMEGDRVRCLVADQVMCAELVKNFETQLEIMDYPHTQDSRLPVAIAVHPDEPKLLRLLNRCLKLINFDHLYEKQQNRIDELKNLNAWDEGGPGPLATFELASSGQSAPDEQMQKNATKHKRVRENK
jgi:hypothetical protein